MKGENVMALLHPEYQLAYERIFNGAVGQRLRKQPVPEKLYHYTQSFDAVKGIIAERTMWLTNMAFLNDVAELDYIKSFEQEEGLDPLVRDYLRAYQPLMADLYTQNYVMSFSSKKDYLPLWATFTKMKGYAIGFDTVSLQNHVFSKQTLNVEVLRNPSALHGAVEALLEQQTSGYEKQGSFGGAWNLYPVIYDRVQQLAILNTTVKSAIQTFIDVKRTAEQGYAQTVIQVGDKEVGRIVKDEAAFTNALNKVFNFCATLFKSDDYAYEHEWRFVKEMNTNNHHLLRSQVFTREADGAIIPYIKMKLRNDLSFPVTDIVTAPLNSFETNVPALSFVLHDAGYLLENSGVKLEQSVIRLRRF